MTIDVFDTALFRSVAQPADVFWLTAYRLNGTIEAKLDIEAFAKARIAAEDRARSAARSQGRFEVTLEQIYHEIPASPISRDRMMAEERATEISVCFANPDMLALYDRLVAAGVRVTFISDTYLDAAFIAKLLSAAGYRGQLQVFTSSTYGLSKADGNLFPVVADALGIAPAKIWHIGDNHNADVRCARQAGWNALWYRPRLANPADHTIGRVGQTRIVASLIEGIAQSLNDGAQDSVWQTIGHRVGAPIFLGFAQFIAQALTDAPADLVAFCARDGRIVRAVYQRLQSITSALPPSIYLLVSRRSLVFPLIEKIGEEELDFLTAQFATLRVGEFLSRIGLDPACYKNDIAKLGLSASTLVQTADDAAKLRHLLRELAPHIIAAAAAERALLKQYFYQEECFLAKDLALVDVGWQGSLQKAAARLFIAEQHSVRLRGFYFGTGPSVKALSASSGATTGWFVDAGLPAERYEVTNAQWAILELLFSAEHGSVLSYRQGDRGIEAVLDQGAETANLQPYERAAQIIQAAALTFIDRYIAAFGGLAPLPITADLVAAPLRRLALAPSLSEARAIGDLFHIDGLGATRTGQYIARPPASVWLARPIGVWNGYRQASWRRGYLVRVFGSRWLALRAIDVLTCLRPGFKSA